MRTEFRRRLAMLAASGLFLLPACSAIDAQSSVALPFADQPFALSIPAPAVPPAAAQVGVAGESPSTTEPFATSGQAATPGARVGAACQSIFLPP